MRPKRETPSYLHHMPRDRDLNREELVWAICCIVVGLVIAGAMALRWWT